MATCGAGDIIALSTIAWKCYKSCRQSSENFQGLSTQISGLKATLDEILEAVEENQPLSPTRQIRLNAGIEDCRLVLADLEEMLQKYESLNTQNQRFYDRLKFGTKDVAELRQRLIVQATNLGALNQAITNSSIAWIKGRLNKYCAEHRGGFRQGSVLSSRTGATIDSVNDWDEIKREVEDMGIPASAIDENQEFIQNWLRDAIEAGALEEEAPPSEGDQDRNVPTMSKLTLFQSPQNYDTDDDENNDSKSGKQQERQQRQQAITRSPTDHSKSIDQQSTLSPPSSTGRTLIGSSSSNPFDMRSQRSQSVPFDNDNYDSDDTEEVDPLNNLQSSAPTLVQGRTGNRSQSTGTIQTRSLTQALQPQRQESYSTAKISTALFEEKWLEASSDPNSDTPDTPPDLKPQTVKRRKSSQLSTLMFKLFSTSQKIIQAASDGDAGEVERLLALGVPVNTKDKWGWTAMSMAAYGGHEEVAKVLMRAGASLDHEDVDGDTPLSLALNRGFRGMVLLIQEEITRRVTTSDNDTGPGGGSPEVEKRGLRKFKTR